MNKSKEQFEGNSESGSESESENSSSESSSESGSENNSESGSASSSENNPESESENSSSESNSEENSGNNSGSASEDKSNGKYICKREICSLEELIKEKKIQICKNHYKKNCFIFSLDKNGLCISCNGKDKKLNKKCKLGTVTKKTCTYDAKSIGFCILHKRYYMFEQLKKLNIKKCKIDTCINPILKDSIRVKCEECRAKEHLQDKKKRETAKKLVDRHKNKNTRICKKCKKEYPLEKFKSVSNKSTVKYIAYCANCNSVRLKADRKRNMSATRKEYKQKYEQQDDVIKRHRKWKKDNPDKLKKYYKDYRKRERKMNEKGYLDRNAETMSLWRINNKVKHKCIDRKSKHSVKYIHDMYVKLANKRDYEFELSNNEVKRLIDDKCYYCGQQPKEVETMINNKVYKYMDFSGIDRMNNSKGYIKGNCTSCCTMCNMMKNVLSCESFLIICERIMYNLQYIRLRKGIGTNVIPDRISATYNKYVHRAKQKENKIDEQHNRKINKREKFESTMSEHKRTIAKRKLERMKTALKNKNNLYIASGGDSSHVKDDYSDDEISIYESKINKIEYKLDTPIDRKKEFEFKLAEDDFKKIISNPCYLCGKENSNKHTNGIDRVDNNIGYIVNNCRSCCSTCNYIKRDYTLQDILIKLYKIHCCQTNLKVSDEYIKNYVLTHKNIYKKLLN